MVVFIKRKFRAFLIKHVNMEKVIQAERSDASRITEQVWLEDSRKQRNQFREHIKKIRKDCQNEKIELRDGLKEHFDRKLQQKQLAIDELKGIISDNESFIKNTQEAWLINKEVSKLLKLKIGGIESVSKFLSIQYASCHGEAVRLVSDLVGLGDTIEKFDTKMRKLLRLDPSTEEVLKKDINSRLIDVEYPDDPIVELKT